MILVKELLKQGFFEIKKSGCFLGNLIFINK
jgi:hypothetical protein